MLYYKRCTVTLTCSAKEGQLPLIFISNLLIEWWYNYGQQHFHQKTTTLVVVLSMFTAGPVCCRISSAREGIITKQPSFQIATEITNDYFPCRSKIVLEKNIPHCTTFMFFKCLCQDEFCPSGQETYLDSIMLLLQYVTVYYSDEKTYNYSNMLVYY